MRRDRVPWRPERRRDAASRRRDPASRGRTAGSAGAAALVVLAACGSSADDTGAPDPTVVAANATVDRVVDGDTVDVRIGGRTERVRLIGIDTPEPPGGIRDPECYGAEASAFTAGLLPEGTPVRLERDAEARDDYGRLLGYVTRAGDGLLVNVHLAEQGYADELTIAPNDTYAPTIRAAVAGARTAGAGLWGACGGPDVTIAG